MQMPTEVCVPYGSPIYHSPVIFIIASLPVVVLNIDISHKTNQYVPEKHMACPPYLAAYRRRHFLQFVLGISEGSAGPFSPPGFLASPVCLRTRNPQSIPPYFIFFAPVPYRDAGWERRELKFCAWLRAGVGHLYNSAPLLAPGAVAREAEFVSVERKAGWTEQQHTHNSARRTFVSPVFVCASAEEGAETEEQRGRSCCRSWSCHTVGSSGREPRGGLCELDSREALTCCGNARAGLQSPVSTWKREGGLCCTVRPTPRQENKIARTCKQQRPGLCFVARACPLGSFIAAVVLPVVYGNSDVPKAAGAPSDFPAGAEPSERFQ